MDTVQLKCPNCGAPINLDPSSQTFACEFCGSDFSKSEIEGANKSDFSSENESSAAQNTEFADNTNLYICDSCGAEIVTDENTAATFCHYCHGAVTLKGRVSGALQPELIIPFAINREKAEETFHKWCGKKWFVPSDFRTEAQLEKMVGLYVPFWLADCDLDVTAEYEAKQIHSHRSGNYRITNTKVYSVSRAARMTYKGVPADGSQKLDDKLMDSVEPFNYNDLKPFSMSWFSGFYADKYDVDKAEALKRIKERMTNGAYEKLSSTVNGYSSVSCRSKNLRVLSTKWHYSMLPVWFMTYIHAGKKYFFAVNGQTGKVAGKLPISAMKLGAFALALFLVVGAVFGFLIGSM